MSGARLGPRTGAVGVWERREGGDSVALRPSSTLDGACRAEASSIDIFGCSDCSEIDITLAGLNFSPEQRIEREFGIVYASLHPRLCPPSESRRKGKQRAATHQMDRRSRHACHACPACEKCFPPVSKNLHVTLTGVPKQDTFSIHLHAPYRQP